MDGKTTLPGEGLMFLLFWILGSSVWGMWLNGWVVGFLGLVSAVVFRLTIVLVRWIEKKF